MTTLLIRNAEALVSMNEAREILHSVDIYCENGIVSKIGHDLQVVAEDVLAQGGISRAINTHHHLYQTFTRNPPEELSCRRLRRMGCALLRWYTGFHRFSGCSATVLLQWTHMFPRQAEPTIDRQIQPRRLGEFHPCRGAVAGRGVVACSGVWCRTDSSGFSARDRAIP